MTIRISVLAAVTATAVGLVFGVSAGAAESQERVISLLSVQQGGNLIDVDRSGGGGPTLGDQYIFTDGLYQWRGTKRGKRVGNQPVERPGTPPARLDEAGLAQDPQVV